MQRQAHRYASRTLLKGTVAIMTREVARECLQAQKIANGIITNLVDSSVDKSETKAISVADDQKKESLAADDICDKLMSLIIGEQISKEVSKSKSSLKQLDDNGNLIGKESEQPADCSNSPSSAAIANLPMNKEDTEND